jgi:hypothetical protein
MKSKEGYEAQALADNGRRDWFRSKRRGRVSFLDSLFGEVLSPSLKDLKEGI